ncbi:replication-relaxation family protein [Microbacterium sp. CFBP 8794]|uniref:replication-relaxation family protein n=1 Tax=Microbacterium sp. CFBP 8794 TaxID=2775269 RepID=UPI00177BA4E4|nr:replication-relaxation family protein [Microbacterium sp. CFBP 8794]MBD8478932.1 replication-relaxation family protein [Microbacterium sp. CFBP 8794]
MTMRLPRTGAGPSRLVLLRTELSVRDEEILAFLNDHRYATTTHLRDVFFAEHATLTAGTRACIRVLHRLLHNRLIARLERRVGGTARGSAATIWYLDAAGERLTRPEGARRRRFAAVSTPFLAHTLTITDTHVALIHRARSGAFAIERVDLEPNTWRSFVTSAGTAWILKPDLFAHLTTDEYDDLWYLEIDLGTESIPVLLAKCRTYAAYKATGRAQAEHGVFPGVLWIVPTPRRVQRLADAIHADPALPNRLFTVITPDQLAATISPADTRPSSLRKEEP